MGIRTFELGTTVQFTFTSSVAPDSAPLFSVVDEHQTLVASETSVASDSTHYYALFTVPTSSHKSRFVATWTAERSFNGTPKEFIARMPFMGIETLA